VDFDPSASFATCSDSKILPSAAFNMAPTTAVSSSVSALVLEYMEKEDLRSLLATDHVRISWIEKLQIALDVSEGMRFLHESDIFHQDLKSVYVLIDRHGRAKLTGGFGGGGGGNKWKDPKSSSKVYRRNDASTKVSFVPAVSVGDCIFTVGRKELLKQADMFAFGVIVWMGVDHREGSMGYIFVHKASKEE
jgi:serine/threonine protein kinase